jgi:1-aminocyclopropane-1-carboxylate deaminase
MDIRTINLLNLNLPSPIEEITNDLCVKKKVQLFIKRDDLINPYISGNKWRKLKDYIQIAQKNNKLGFISYGGAYSNHLYALAYLGNKLSLETIGIIRGEELSINSNPFLSQMSNWGMKLFFVNRESYKQKIIPESITNLKNYLLIPEGGYSEIGIKSVASMANEINLQGDFDFISLAVGTGTTAIGLSKFSKSEIIGIMTLRNLDELALHFRELNYFPDNLTFIEQKDALKYGKIENHLSDFCIQFQHDMNIKIEPIYTGKMFYRLYQLIEEDFFPVHSKILAIHTGGIK